VHVILTLSMSYIYLTRCISEEDMVVFLIHYMYLTAIVTSDSTDYDCMYKTCDELFKYDAF